MMTIHNIVSMNRTPNCKSLSERLGVDPRTVQRDITFMRDSWDLPIKYDPGVRGYRYTGEVTSLPVTKFNIKEVRVLKSLLKYLPSDDPEDKVIHLQSVISKITSLYGLPDEPEAA
jgi:predicted DNA-binding transcriptional regulator YafY